jgi:Tfp pilus assembly protein PilW
VLRPTDLRRRDGGFTVVELAVATAVTAVILAAVVAGLRVVVDSFGRVQDSGLAADRGHILLDRFDRDLRQASALNRPTRVGSRVYVEYETDLTDTGSPSTCTQWRVDSATGTLDVRSWAVDAGTAPGFTTAAAGVVNDPAAEPTFVVTPAGAGAVHQQLTVTLRLALAHGQALTRATVTARNSSASSPSNADADGDGASDSPVCAAFGRP